VNLIGGKEKSSKRGGLNSDFKTRPRGEWSTEQ